MGDSLTPTVIFRASSSPAWGPHAHLLAEPAVPQGATVVRTLCGRTGIGPVVEREDATCPECWASSGRHPGKRGKLHLARQWAERSR